MPYRNASKDSKNMISSPVIFKDADYTPYGYDRAYPIYEVHPRTELAPGIYQQKQFYRDALQQLCALETVTFNDKGETMLVAQRLYAEDRKDQPNWRSFDREGLYGQGHVRYTPADKIVQDGIYTLRYRDNLHMEVPYKGGVPHGESKKYCADGGFEKATLVNGVKQGLAENHSADGTIETFFYVDDVPQGAAVKKSPNGVIQHYNYVDGVKQGKGYQENPDGTLYSYWYVDGNVEGLSCLIDSYDCITRYSIRIAGDPVYSFLPDKETPKRFNRTAKELAVPVRDIGTLYKEALAEMTRQHVNQNEIIDMGLRMQPLMEAQG